MKSVNSVFVRLAFVLASLLGFHSAQAQSFLFSPAGFVNFTNTTAGSVSAEQTISAQYFGPPFQMHVTSVVPPANSAFTVTSNTCTARTYNDFESCFITFTYTASNTAGAVTDVFRLVTTEFGNLDITLRGNSDGAPVVVTPTAPTPVPTTGLLAILFGGAAIGGSVVWTRNRSKQQKS